MNKLILIYVIRSACIRGKVKIQVLNGLSPVKQLDIQAYPVASSGYKICEILGRNRPNS